MLTIGSLFSGIGGLELGLERAGLGPVKWQVEIDPFCRDVLAKYWPDVERFEDVNTATPSRVDLICGGFPCQPVSTAGKRRGQDDPRWLWPAFARQLEDLRPRWVVIENVPGLRTRGLRNVLGDLTDLGYDAEWRYLAAEDVGAPHRRTRLFVVAYTVSAEVREQPGRLGGPYGQGEALAGLDGIVRELADSAGEGIGPVESGVGRSLDGVPRPVDGVTGEQEASTLRKAVRYVRRPHVAQAIWQATRGCGRVQAEEVLFAFLCEYSVGGRISRGVVASATSPEGLLRAMRAHRETGGAPLRREQVEQLREQHPDALRELSRLVASRGRSPWLTGCWEGFLPRTAVGVPRRMDRLRALGNAVVPQCAEAIGRCIVRVLTTACGDAPLDDEQPVL